MPILQATGISKAYGSVDALKAVSLSVEQNEIHAVLGENGAGKSTLVGVLSGFVKPDTGQVEIEGRSLRLGMPTDARKAHIELVHQHFMLVSRFTVIENLMLFSTNRLASAIPRNEIEAKTRRLLEALGWQLELEAAVESLPVGVRQRLEIIKALLRDAKILILDEPTASLSSAEVEDLFTALKQLQAQGTTIILIAHKLSEIMAIAERVTVLRRGEVVAASKVSDTNVQQLAEWMVGELPHAISTPKTATFQPGLEVKDLSVKSGRVRVEVSHLAVGKSEILGIGGVDGNGQVELAEALVGVRPYLGTIMFSDRSQPQIAYIPQDRQRDGLALSMSALDNLFISGRESPELVAKGWIKLGKLSSWASGLVHDFEIRLGSLAQPASSLSGGNQQKLVLARNLSKQVDLLVAVNPTRGLDLRATSFVHKKILEAAKEGASVVLISSDLDELAQLAHRTLFLSSGQLQDVDGAASLVGA